MSRLMGPEPGTRWVHRDCKRIAVVVSVMSSGIVEYHYEKTVGVAPGRIRRLGSKGKTATPTQTLALDDWHRLFRERAVERGKRAMP